MSYEIVGVPVQSGNRWFVLGRCACGAERRFRCRKDGVLEKPACECRRCRDERRRTDRTFAATMGGFARIHGHAGVESPTHRSWHAMLTRCTNPASRDFARYGAKGIKVAARWRGAHGFENFLADMGERTAGTTLDRFPKKRGDYRPGNCRWATPTQQANNRGDNVMLVVDGVRYTLTEAADVFGLPRSLIYQRTRRGWSDDDTAKTPALTT